MAAVEDEGVGGASDLTGPKVEGARRAGGAARRGCGGVGVGTKLAVAAGAVTVAVVVAVVAIGGEGEQGGAEARSMGWVQLKRRVVRVYWAYCICIGPPVLDMP